MLEEKINYTSLAKLVAALVKDSMTFYAQPLVTAKENE